MEKIIRFELKKYDCGKHGPYLGEFCHIFKLWQAVELNF